MYARVLVCRGKEFPFDLINESMYFEFALTYSVRNTLIIGHKYVYSICTLAVVMDFDDWR